MTHEIEALERRGWDALCGAGGAAFYDEVMADEAVMVFPGLTLTRAATIAAIATEEPWSRYALDDVRIVGDDQTAAITYHVVAQRPNEDAYHARMSSVYVRRDGQWRLLVHQQSPDPAI